MQLSEKQKALTAVGLVSFFWGTTYLASRVGVRFIPGLLLAGLRQFAAGIILVTFFLARRYKLPDAKSFGKIIFAGFFILVIGNGVFTWSMQYIPSGLASVLSALIPMWVALFSILLLRQTRFNIAIILGLILGFAGILLIFDRSNLSATSPHFSWGVLLSLCSGIGWSLGSVYVSKLKVKIPLLFVVGLQMLTSGTTLILICVVTNHTVNLLTLPRHGWIALLYLIFIGSLLTYAAYVYALLKLPPTRVSIYAYFNPVVAIFLGWLILQEPVNMAMLAGSAITITGIYLVNSGYKKQLR